MLSDDCGSTEGGQATASGARESAVAGQVKDCIQRFSGSVLPDQYGEESGVDIVLQSAEGAVWSASSEDVDVESAELVSSSNACGVLRPEAVAETRLSSVSASKPKLEEHRGSDLERCTLWQLVSWQLLSLTAGK